MKKGEIVFEYDSVGDLFYIILSGTVSIFIPDKESGEKHRRLSIFEKTQIGSKDLDEMIKFIEIVTLGPGKSFGELALIKSSTRAARVICKEDCKFAVLNKDLYQNVLRKIDEQNKEDKINFLKQIPLFKYWSKNALGKLCYAIEVITCIRGQKIIKEGDPSDYWVLKFEIVKHLGKECVERQNNLEEQELIRPLLAHADAKRCLANGEILAELKNKVRLSIIGDCKILGDNDARFSRNYTYTVVTNCIKDYSKIDARSSLEKFSQTIEIRQGSLEASDNKPIVHNNFTFQKVTFRNSNISNEVTDNPILCKLSETCNNTERANTSSSPYRNIDFNGVKRNGKSLLVGNPVYQSKYVLKNRSEIRRKLQCFLNNSSTSPRFDACMSNRNNKVSIPLNSCFRINQLNTNRSCEGTSKSQLGKTNMSCMFKTNLKPKVYMKKEQLQIINDFNKTGNMFRSCDMNNSKRIWRLGSRDTPA